MIDVDKALPVFLESVSLSFLFALHILETQRNVKKLNCQLVVYKYLPRDKEDI